MSGCTLKDSIHLVNSLSNSFIEWQRSWNNCSNLMRKSKQLLTNLIPVVRHFHKAHAHPLYGAIAHPPSAKSTGKYGLMKPCFLEFAILKLYWELWHGIDKDRNGLVYGRDFIIDDDDPEKPYNLKLSEISAKLIVGELPYGPEKRVVSWDTYLASVGAKKRQLPTSLESRIIQEALLKQKVNFAEGNCKNEIYGVTFIIDPEDPEKPQYLIDLEEELDLIPPKKKMKYADFLKNCQDYQDSLEAEELIENQIEECSYVCTRLLGEWLKGYDIDNNGLIYGKDFFISNLEPKKCKCLRELEYDIEWNPTEDTKEMMWDEFSNTFPNKNPDDRGDY